VLPEPVGSAHIGGSVAVADELHMVFECPAVQAVRQQYAPLFSTDTNTMRSFFAQQDHMQVFKFVLDCLDVFQNWHLSSSVCDQTCWLAKAL